MTRRLGVVAVLAVLQLAIVVVAVSPRLSAHLRGEEYRLQVAAVDPIDPLRGAYVELTYPGLRPARGQSRADLPEGRVFVPLVRDGEYWKAGRHQVDRPEEAPYLACESTGWSMSCGIESWFTDEDEARRLEAAVSDGAVATVKVDDRGNAVIVALDEE